MLSTLLLHAMENWWKDNAHRNRCKTQAICPMKCQIASILYVGQVPKWEIEDFTEIGFWDKNVRHSFISLKQLQIIYQILKNSVKIKKM